MELFVLMNGYYPINLFNAITWYVIYGLMSDSAIMHAVGCVTSANRVYRDLLCLSLNRLGIVGGYIFTHYRKRHADDCRWNL